MIVTKRTNYPTSPQIFLAGLIRWVGFVFTICSARLVPEFRQVRGFCFHKIYFQLLFLRFIEKQKIHQKNQKCASAGPRRIFGEGLTPSSPPSLPAPFPHLFCFSFSLLYYFSLFLIFVYFLLSKTTENSLKRRFPA